MPTYFPPQLRHVAHLLVKRDLTINACNGHICCWGWSILRLASVFAFPVPGGSPVRLIVDGLRTAACAHMLGGLCPLSGALLLPC